MDQRIIRPQMYMRAENNRQEMLSVQDGIADGANEFKANSFVVLTAGLVAAVVTGGVLTCGFVVDDSKAKAEIDPPYAPFGDKHFPFNLNEMIFLISVTNGTGAVGQAALAPKMSDIVLGAEYGLIRPVGGANDGIQMLNSADATTTLFKVVDKPREIPFGQRQDANTYNPIVAVKIIESKIQKLI